MRKAILVLFSFFVLSCAGIVGLAWITKQHNPDLAFLSQALFFITVAAALPWVLFIIMALLIIPHELGHFLAAKKNGFKVLFIDILGFQLWFLDSKVKSRFAISRNILGMVVFGKKNAKIGEIRQAIAAGPISNLLCGIVLLPFAISGGSWYSGLIQILMVGHFWLGISNLLPLGEVRDGARLRLSFREPEKMIAMVDMWYESIQLQLVRPREWDTSVFNFLNEPRHDAMIFLNQYWALMDRGQVRLAEKPLRQAFTIVVDNKLKFEPAATILVETSTYFSRFILDPQTADLAKVCSRQLKLTPIQMLSLKAAEKWSSGKKNEAVLLWKSVRDKYSSTVVIEVYKDHSQDWCRRLITEDMIFETDRLFARLWREEDLSSLVSIYTNPEVRKYLSPHQPSTPEAIEANIKGRLNDQKDWTPGYGAWALVRKEDERLIGAVFCGEFPNGDKEIAWHLGQEY